MTAQATVSKSRPGKALFVALALVFLGGFGASLVQSDFGAVTVTGLKFPTENGQWITADLFKPVSATASNPVPLVIVCPGFERSKETMSGYSIELARRGMAVITIDPYNQGASSSTMQRRSASKEGYGIVPVAEYVRNTPNLNYVDKSRIGAAGYSAGGNAVLQCASLFGARKARALRQAQRSDSDGGRQVTDAELAGARAQNILSAVFVGGYVLTMTDDVLDTVEANVGMDYASYDEGAYRTESGHAQMGRAPEALRLVNSGLGEDAKIREIEVGRAYGAAERGTLRIVHNTGNVHPVLPYDPRFIAHLADFFDKAFRLEPAIAPGNQTWFWKELFTLVSLLGGLLFILPFTALLLRLPVFAPLAQPLPPAAPKPGRAGKTIFWCNFAVSAALACFLFMPMARATATLFPQASAAQQTWWFPQRINNALLLWAVANGLIGLGIFTAVYRAYGRRHGAATAIEAIRIGARQLALTLALALCVSGAFYLLVFSLYGLFHTDMRFVFVAATAAFPVRMLRVALEYLPLFFIFYAANSIRVNCAARFQGQVEWKNRLVNGLANSVGLLLILVVQYSWLARTGRVFWTDGWLYVNLLLGVIPLMFLLPYFNRSFFQLTGKVWLGPMVTCLIFIMMMLSNNVCYIPLR
jgi:dienelactone hydrolase/uncharacterized membrane protein